MYIKTAFMSGWSVLSAAAAACMVFAGTAAAANNNVTVAIHVSSEGLDLSQPAGAQELYSRINYAARVACTHGNRVGLELYADYADFAQCFEKALGNAVRSANLKPLTQAYLATHTRREATALGIEVPVQVAAR